VGNVANVAYSTAKFQRRMGLEAALFLFREDYAMAHPEWEDADFDVRVDLAAPDWESIPFANRYRRPGWVHYLDGPLVTLAAIDPAGSADSAGLPPVPGQVRRNLRVLLRAQAARGQRRLSVLRRTQDLNRSQRFELMVLSLASEALDWLFQQRMRSDRLSNAELRATRADVAAVRRHSRLSDSGVSLNVGDLARFAHWRSVLHASRAYDLSQLYGLEAAKGVFLPPEHPLIAVEHSTMRSLPFENSVRGRLLNLAYRAADACVITNPDVVASATRLGLTRYRYIPHPLDETKYRDGPSPLTERLRRDLHADVIFICPTRHEWGNAFDSKRTDRALQAFVRYVRESEPAGCPRAGLILWEWGTDVAKGKRLLSEAGLNDRVQWQPAMPKLRLLDYYRASDVVLDQFHDAVGSFGTATAEAMACGRPVVMYFNPIVHEWCLPEMPPIQSARTVDEILSRLVDLAADPERRRRVGAAGRAWVERWHGWERTTRLYLELYAEIADRRGLAVPPLPTTASSDPR